MKYYVGDQIKVGQMDETCSTHVGDLKMRTSFLL
jgi:hypothetical protein